MDTSAVRNPAMSCCDFSRAVEVAACRTHTVTQRTTPYTESCYRESCTRVVLLAICFRAVCHRSPFRIVGKSARTPGEQAHANYSDGRITGESAGRDNNSANGGGG